MLRRIRVRSMDKHAVALVLSEIGTLLELHGENRFKARAFLMAARSVEKLDEDLTSLVRSGRLESVRGVGPATARVIRDLVETGTSRYYRELRERTPDGMRELLAVPGLGAAKIRQLHEELGIQSVEDLEKAAAEGRIAEVRGFGTRTQEKLALGIGFVRGATGRRRMSQALEPAARVLGFLRGLAQVRRVELAGEARRWLETVSGIELVASVPEASIATVVSAFVGMPGMAQSEHDSNEAVGRLADGLTLRLLCVPPSDFPLAWLLRTGSEMHLAQLFAHAATRGIRIDESGLRRHGKRLAPRTEEALYQALGLQWIPPELREGQGEVAAAADDALPALVEYEQIRGCFHCHTVASDGKATVAELAGSARERGWRYIGIADHSQNAGYAGGLSPEEITVQHEEIDRWNDEHGNAIRVLKGVEADILSDGRVDYEQYGDRVLGRFDYVVASVHSAFGMPRAQMTARVLRALDNPHVSILGHLTGRLLLTRDAYAIDVEAVLDRAAQRGVAVEINADPFRMDLDWRYWRGARERGVRTAINPDAHSTRALDNVALGVTLARKGWLTASDVVNAWDLEAVLSFFRGRS
jgi:DNA polymerase (family 10)